MSISLEKVDTNQIKAVIPTGAPFDITLPISGANGSLSGGTTLTIPTGSVESTTQNVTRTPNTIAAVTTTIGTLPTIPTSHSGYVLAKVGVLPLEIFSEINVAPVFTDGTATTRIIAENTAADTDIGNLVSATDANNDRLIYTLTGTDSASFSIVNTTGLLKTKAALDYETKTSYTVTITVSDGNLTDSISVTINVIDVDENRAPEFTDGESTTRAVAENTGPGVNIGTAVSATDADEDTITYTLSGTDGASFSIVSTSGQLQTSAALDYEDKRSYSVIVTATDNSGASNNSATITVTISVTDVDENRAPSFTESSISFSISDIASASVGDSIGLPITASDDDDDTLEYSLGGDDASKFTIDSSSAQLKVTQALIDDTSSSYSIKVIATDPDNVTAEISVTITVTRLTTQQQQQSNSTPTFDEGANTTRSIVENIASGEICTHNLFRIDWMISQI